VRRSCAFQCTHGSSDGIIMQCCRTNLCNDVKIEDNYVTSYRLTTTPLHPYPSRWTTNSYPEWVPILGDDQNNHLNNNNKSCRLEHSIFIYYFFVKSISIFYYLDILKITF
jgi:hypothetical protein